MNIISSFLYIERNISEFILKLIDEYPSYVQEPERLRDIMNCFELNSLEYITIIVESNHVDKQYRDAYYSYFSQKYLNFDRNCLRLAFFRNKIKYNDFMTDVGKLEKNIIGTVVLRPLNVGNIGYTLLDPQKLKIKGFIRTCEFKITICGRKFRINAFPYLSQDNETMTCAETALYNLIQYYSQKYCEYRILMPSEILHILEESSYERVLPSHGVYDIGMAKVLQAGHFYPRLYSYNDEDGKEFDDLFYSYIESGIPFILGLPQHVVICVGHGEVDYKMEKHDFEKIVFPNPIENTTIYTLRSSLLIDEYIFMDDNQPPYVLSNVNNLTIHYYNNIVDIEQEDEYDGYETENEDEDDDVKCGDKCDKIKYSTQVCYSEDIIEDIKKRYNSLLVPLYKRIFLDAARAKSIFEAHFLYNPNFIERIQDAYTDDSWGSSPMNPLVWRMYLAPSSNYKDFKCNHITNEKLFDYYSSQSYPRFIWVLEIGTVSTFSEKKACVEVLLDATSSRNSETWAILSVSYYRHLVFVPYVLNCIYGKKIHCNYDWDSDSINWSDINEQTEQFVLTEIFNTLFHQEISFVEKTFDIFANSNLKEIK